MKATTASVDRRCSTTSRYYRERAELQTKDVAELTMIHTKTMAGMETTGWAERCTTNSEWWNEKCFVGFAWPLSGYGGGDSSGNQTRKICWMFDDGETTKDERGTTGLKGLCYLSSLTFRERDELEVVFKSWAMDVEFNVRMLRDYRLRHYYGERYDR